MRVGIVNEVSACAKNKDIVAALETLRGVEILNLGMKDPQEDHPITYIQTGLMSAILLNCGICDFIIGGCGTGQGFLNSVMQYPGVFCGLIQEPLDAWLFSQINGGNCISLALNKGYGWAADINLKYIFERLFQDPAGRGYPPARAQSQQESRECLKGISRSTHMPLDKALDIIDRALLAPIAKRDDFMEALREQAQNSELAERVYTLIRSAA